MKSMILITACAAMSACATTAKVFPAKLVKTNGQLHVVEYRTGTSGESLYDEMFKAAASDACKGKSYTVSEKAHVPSIFKCAESVLDPEKFYWVIKCDGK